MRGKWRAEEPLLIFFHDIQAKKRKGWWWVQGYNTRLLFFSNPFFTAASRGSGSVCVRPNQSFHCLPQRWYGIKMALVRWRAISQIYAWAVRAIISSFFTLGNGGSRRDGIICRKCYQGSTDIRCDPATSKFASVDHDYVFCYLFVLPRFITKWNGGIECCHFERKMKWKRQQRKIGNREEGGLFLSVLRKKEKKVWAKNVREIGFFCGRRFFFLFQTPRRLSCSRYVGSGSQSLPPEKIEKEKKTRNSGTTLTFGSRKKISADSRFKRNRCCL